MTLGLFPAAPADAGRISEIHMAAFASNVMLLAQFPTPEAREELRESIRLKARADIEYSRITVLVVRDIPSESDASIIRGVDDGTCYYPAVKGVLSESQNAESQAGKVVALAKWSHPVAKDEEYEETPWIWPPGTNMAVLESWGRATEEAQEQAVGDRPCYRLTFMGTDPIYERRGAAAMMVRWGLEKCRRDNVPGYLESTLDAAPFYEKMDFAKLGPISLRYQLQDKGRNKDEVYEEIAFVFDQIPK
ncbi:putative GNAT family acetyltransferase [Xylaria palmicola]|nr:putative GNAT family acetyltransferase [Xylaria palmicola]